MFHLSVELYKHKITRAMWTFYIGRYITYVTLKKQATFLFFTGSQNYKGVMINERVLFAYNVVADITLA